VKLGEPDAEIGFDPTEHSPNACMDITCMDASWTGIFGNSTRPTATVSPTTRPIGQCDQARIDSTDHSNFKAVDTTKTHVLGVEFYGECSGGTRFSISRFVH